MSQTAAETRRQQRLEELCAASMRALSGHPLLQFRGHRLHDGVRRLPLGAPHLRTDPARDDFDSMRGAADGVAMRLMHSDAAQHAARLPEPPVQRLLFELFEQYRCEALAELPGVRRNLRHRHEAWSQHWHDSGLNGSTSGLLLHTIAQISRSHITGEPVLETTQDLMEGVRANLAPEVGHRLAGMRRARRDQQAFAEHALALAQHVAERVEQAFEDEREQARGRGDASQVPLELWVDDDGDDAAPGGEPGGRRAGDATPAAGYRAFTTAHDREVAAASLVRAARLRECRERLDARIVAQGANLPRLVRELRALLAEPAADGWDGAQEEGLIDGRRLASLVASPAERRLFRQRRSEPLADAAVTLLVDCSGSMKVHAESVAMLADVLLRALEQAGAVCELLGFTTGAWNGGKPLREWRQAGCPPAPGRLNEVQHLVFKHFDEPWRHARNAVSALLESHLFREGIDGEAVEWASARLLAREARQRVLIVVSDGCPMDTATQQTNGEFYLDQHLREVVTRLEAQGGLRIAGLGLGLDLSPYYRCSRVVEIDTQVRNQVFREVVGLLRETLSR